MSKRDGCVWLLVTDDEYEFPLEMGDTPKELAEKIGRTENNISSAISKAKSRGNKCIYKKVKIDGFDWED